MDDPINPGKAVGEPCTTTDECADTLICKDVMTSDGSSYEMLCAHSYEPPTDYDGVGMARNGTVVGYWYLNEDRTEFDGNFVSNDGMTTGKWRYDDGTELSGTW
jgi:hypothetical protein